MSNRSISLIFGALVSGCAASATTSAPRPQADPGAATAGDILGLVDGSPVRRQELNKEITARMSDLQNEAAQRQFHLLWAGLEDAIGERLLTKEAAQRNVSVDDLREAEIAAKVAMPTDDEVRKVYDENIASSGLAFDKAAPHIRNQMMSERLELQERAFVEQLREKADVRYALPAPELPRFAIEKGSGPAAGPADAKVTLVEFSDFQCPYCSRASGLVKRLRELYPHALRVEFRDFPLQQHPEARAASEAARCADEQNKFWEYHDALFANQQAQKSEDLERYAEQAKLDIAAFKTCLASGRAGQAVRASEELGRKNGIQGTPAIYINGIKLVGLLPLPLMQALIDRELQE